MVKGPCQIEQIEEIAQNLQLSHLYNSPAMRKIFLTKPKDGEVDPVLLQNIRQTMRDFICVTVSPSGDNLEEELQAFDKVMWPKLEKALVTHPSATMWLQWCAKSRWYAADFLLSVVEGDLASAVLAANGIGRSVLGHYEAIPFNDAAIQFCLEESTFKQVRVRVKAEQALMVDAHKILMLCGGAAPALYVRGFELSQDQQVTIVDQRNYADALEQLLDCDEGTSLADRGVKYVVSDVTEYLGNTSEYGKYDLVLIMGFASYVESVAGLVAASSKFLSENGKLGFDLQTMVDDGTYQLAVNTVLWPPTMKVRAGKNVAMMDGLAALEAAGLTYVPVDSEPYWVDAGIVIVGQKP